MTPNIPDSSTKLLIRHEAPAATKKDCLLLVSLNQNLSEHDLSSISVLVLIQKSSFQKLVYSMNQHLHTMANHRFFSHNNPWAHSAICCDRHHGESTSAATARLAGNISVSHDQNLHNRHLEYHDSSGCNSECPLDTYCCSGDYCCDKHGSCSSGDECCDGPSCEEAQRPDSRASHHSHRSHSKTEQRHNRSHQQPMSLEEWAVTQEGCDAIQQLVSWFTLLPLSTPQSLANTSLQRLNAVTSQTAIYQSALRTILKSIHSRQTPCLPYLHH